MKIWMKYLVGAILGLAIGLVLPLGDSALQSTISFLATLSIRIGRYALVPLILFSVPIATYELNEDKDFWRILGRTLAIIVASVIVFVLVGIVSAAVAAPARIPLLQDANQAAKAPNYQDILLSVFPTSLFSALSSSGDFLLPVYFLAVILGFAFSYDKLATKPAVSLFDSLSRIFYQINTFFAEFLGVLVIAVTAFNVLALRSVVKSEVYRPLLIVVCIEVLVVTFVAIPALLYFVCGKKQPYKWLYALAAPALAALVSGDVYFPLGSLTKHAKESLGIRRRINSLSIPLTIIFGRAGTALVTATAFIAVLSSYSSMGLSIGSLVWLLAAAPLLTLLLGAAPSGGALTALTALCAFYGKGFENGYLIIAPMALPLVCLGAFLDVLWAGCVSLMVAKATGQQQEKEVRFYI
jgi:Na+/H+-dicarboxylate symporter